VRCRKRGLKEEWQTSDRKQIVCEYVLGLSEVLVWRLAAAIDVL